MITLTITISKKSQRK